MSVQERTEPMLVYRFEDDSGSHDHWWTPKKPFDAKRNHIFNFLSDMTRYCPDVTHVTIRDDEAGHYITYWVVPPSKSKYMDIREYPAT